MFTNTAWTTLPRAKLLLSAESSDTAMPSPLNAVKSPLTRPKLNTEVMVSGSTAMMLFTEPSIWAWLKRSALVESTSGSSLS